MMLVGRNDRGLDASHRNTNPFVIQPGAVKSILARRFQDDVILGDI